MSSPSILTDEPSADEGGLLKVLIIIAMLVIAVCAGFFIVRSTPKSKTPAPIVDGRGSATSIPVQTFGLDKYPGARPVQASSTDAEQVLASFETNDSPEQVIGYYRVRFPVAQVSMDATHSTLAADMNGRQVLVTADALVHGSRVRVSVATQANAR